MTHSRKTITQLLDDFELHPSRALGQNFVGDANTVRRIARLADVGRGDFVVEVGAGLGSLTLALVETGAEVTTIELDKHVLPVLAGVLAETSVRLVEGDALRLDWNDIVPQDKAATVVANLPYNVGTAIVIRLLEEVPQVKRIVVMLQKEVGERLCARVGDDAYGALSVKVAYHARARALGVVPPTVFVPKPDVDSLIVELQRWDDVPVSVDYSFMFALVKAGFGQRRKMLRSSLKSLVTNDAFEVARVAPTARAEELDVEAWARLSNANQS